MDLKKLAMILGIAILMPLFIALFVDALYTEPQYDKYCPNNYKTYPTKIDPNCTYTQTQLDTQCYNDGGMVDYNYTNNGCQVFDKCNYCNKDFNDAQQLYNRNIFFVLMPLGLIIVILGIYLTIDYLGAGLMFAGLITMFYATMRYFGDMSKMLRALVILIELLIIMWIGYKKIGYDKNESNENNNNTKKNKSKHSKK